MFRSRWIALRFKVLSTIFAASLAIYLVYGPRAKAAATGFVLDQAGM